MKIGIIGCGEIGSSLYKVYQEKGYNTVRFDPYQDFHEDVVGCDILNICIPYTDEFIGIVNHYIKIFEPWTVVIHSTVAPGTTSQIKFDRVIHSPVRGLHPNLDKGIKTFVKFIGCEYPIVAESYEKHLETLGITSYICKNSLTTEYAKLLDTTYYGMCIAFHNDVQKLCEDNNISFIETFSIYNETYNIGYERLGKTNVQRPILEPGIKIGGHCVVPNAKILKPHIESDAINMILKYEVNNESV